MENKTPEDVTIADLESCFLPEFNADVFETLTELEVGQITLEEAYFAILNRMAIEAGAKK